MSRFSHFPRIVVGCVATVAMLQCGSESGRRTSPAGGAGADPTSGSGGGATTMDASVAGGTGGIAGSGATTGRGGGGGPGMAGAGTGGAAGVGTGGSAGLGGGSGGSSTGGAAGVDAGGGSGSGGKSGASGSSGGARDGGGNDGAAGSFAGSAGTAGASGGSADAAIGDGGTVIWTATDYKSRKWARWPVPNPPSLGLPNPMSFAAATDTVTDNVTGLVWQKTTNTATTTWQAALDYCVSLGAGWSLPTRIELSSILDNTRSGAKVAPEFTFGNSAGWTWASTPWVVNERKGSTGDAALSWFINFSQGDSNNSLSQTAASAYARCVRVPATQTLPALHYAVLNGEVKDNYTGLVWQQGHSGSTATLAWDQADAYCKSLALNGETWRLPSLNEIASIVDDVPSGDVSPAVDHATFPMTSPDLQYWSASPYGTSTAERWTLNFKDGFTAHRMTSMLAIARCVR